MNLKRKYYKLLSKLLRLRDGNDEKITILQYLLKTIIGPI